MTSPPRIALIHAVQAAMQPIARAMADIWPEAEAVNILDDSLTHDRRTGSAPDPSMTKRFTELARYGEMIGSAGILFTCSAFGPAIERAAAEARVPVLKPNEAMFEAAIGHGARSAMLATFGAAIPTMEAEFAAEASRSKTVARLTAFVVEGAMAALKAGAVDEHNRLIAEQARRLGNYDAIMLAHFSTSQAADAVREVTDIPVLTSPDTAVSKMKRLLTGGSEDRAITEQQLGRVSHGAV